MSDSERPQTPAQAGKELADPSDMSTQEPQQTDGKPVAQQIENFADLNATQTGMNRWTVTNRANGTAYQLRIGGENGIECDCPDHKYSPSDDEFAACKHVLYVGFQSRRSMDSDVWSIQQLAELHRNVTRAAEQARAAVEGIDEALIRTRETAAETATDPAENEEQEYEGYDIDNLEADLWKALENAGFELKGSGRGTYEGTDQLKFSLGHEDFDELKRVTSECKLVGFDGEMNAIDVSDVNEYVETVLE